MNLVNQGIVAFLLTQAALSSSVEFGNPLYLIVSPGLYRPGTVVTLGVDLFGEKSCLVEVNLFSSKVKNVTVSTAKGTFTPGTHGELKLQVPGNVKGRLTIEGVVCGVKTPKKHIKLGTLRDSLYIQTDKPIYKPGQKIHMRVISLGHDLKPVGMEASSVIVKEPSGSRVMQWNNVTLQDGIASLELQLSKEPVLGVWVIRAVVGKTKAEQKIEVAKYVLPKFEVKVKAPSYMALDQKDFTTSICAKYTYGKSVKGKLSALLCLKHTSYESKYKNITVNGITRRRWVSSRRVRHSACHNISKEINGCTDITLSRGDLNVSSVRRPWSAVFSVKAAVTETLTEVTLFGSAANRGMRRRSVRLDFTGTSTQFKPGLPFKYVLKVTHPDGTPATGVRVKVFITRGYFYFGNSDIFYNKTFTVKNGLIKEALDNLAHNAKSLNFRAVLLDKNPYKNSLRYSYTVTAYFTANAWYSPSLSYLQLSKTRNLPAKVGRNGQLKVRYTVRNDTGKKVDFYYNVLCKGNMVTSGVHTQHHPYVQEIEQVPTTAMPTTTASTTEIPTTQTTEADANQTATADKGNLTIIAVTLKPYTRRRWRPWRPPTPPPLKDLPEPVVEEFEITIPTTAKMVPSCRILMYYVRPDKETVADSIVYDVEDKLENQVSVSFSDAEKKPGDKTTLVLKAKPGSRVAFVAVDKSVHLLKAGNELTKEKIMPILQRLDSGRAWNEDNRCRRPYWPYWRGKRTIIGPWWHSSYEDASEAFNAAGLVFLSNLTIFTKPCPDRTILPLVYEMASADMDDDDSLNTGRTGMVAESGGRTRNRFVPKKEKKPAAKPVRVRKEFPETWLWADEKLDENSGIKTLKVKVPDTITTWIANGFAMSSVAGIGVSAPASIKAFQPFFVQMTLPYSVIRGEEIPVTVTVFNYMSSCVPIKLTLNRDSSHYKVTSYNIHKMCVCGDAGQSVKFTIIPTKIGHIPLTVVARTSTAPVCKTLSAVAAASDAVTRKLLVEPEGIRQDYTKSTFFCPKGGSYKERFDLRLPNDIVPGSVYSTVSIIGDIMGPALSNLDGLLRMPYGCGEQNMAKFAPNIYIMDYLSKTNQVTKEIEAKAKSFMSSGYQRELIYKRENGSYSAFGNRDKQGSMMLTAFVVRSFARAKKYIFVDEKHIDHSIKWFRRKQLKSGCFPKYGKVFSRRLQGGVNSEVTISAYVTIALLEAGKNPKDPMVSKALSCIANQLDSIKDSYTTALVSYMLVLADHPKAAVMMKKLRRKAISKDGQMYWSASSDKTAPTTPPPYWWYYRAPSTDVEMTGYALLALLKHDKSFVSTDGDVLNIIRWLSKQRNAYGGFSSTQDTCVALQALSEFAGIAYGNGTDVNSNSLKGSLKIKGGYRYDFDINNANRLVLQRDEIPAKYIPNSLTLNAMGSGCALLQTSVRYNIPSPKEIPAFSVKVGVRRRRSAPDEETTPCNPLKLEISAKWLEEDVSNMAVVDIKLVTGFSVRVESLEKLGNDPALNFKRYDVDGQNVMLYFDEIKDITFSIDIHQDTLVKKTKPAVVRVYDYYDPESQAKVMYKIGEKECYGDKLENMCPKCMTVAKLNDVLKIKGGVSCSTTISRVKSSQGMLKVKGYVNTGVLKGKKTVLPYEIPEFCPCEQIYNNAKALVIGEKSYFKENGKETTIVFSAGTKIVKWKKKNMKASLKRKIKKIIQKCRRQG